MLINGHCLHGFLVKVKIMTKTMQQLAIHCELIQCLLLGFFYFEPVPSYLIIKCHSRWQLEVDQKLDRWSRRTNVVAFISQGVRLSSFSFLFVLFIHLFFSFWSYRETMTVATHTHIHLYLCMANHQPSNGTNICKEEEIIRGYL